MNHRESLHERSTLLCTSFVTDVSLSTQKQTTSHLYYFLGTGKIAWLIRTTHAIWLPIGQDESRKLVQVEAKLVMN